MKTACQVAIIALLSLCSYEAFAQNSTQYAGTNCVEADFPSGSSFYASSSEIVNYTGSSEDYLCPIPIDQTSGFSTSDSVAVFAESTSSSSRLSCTIFVKDALNPGTVYWSGSYTLGPAATIQNFLVYFPSLPTTILPLATLYCTVPDDAQINGYKVNY